jgi:hypothetical protein
MSFLGDFFGPTRQTQVTSSRTDPWARTTPTLDQLINQVNGRVGDVGLSGEEQVALQGLADNARAGNPYAGGIGRLATDLLGGGFDRSPYVTRAYDELHDSLLPYTTASTNPYDNEAFAKTIGFLSNDITDRIRSQYAGAGYSPTGAGDFTKTLGEGIARGVAPAWLQAQNELENRKLGAINSLYGAGNTTAGLLSGFDQAALGNRRAGVDVAQSALAANDAPYARMLEIEAQRRGIPLQNIAGLQNLIVPMARLGGTSNATTNSATQVPLGQQLFGGGKNGMLGGMIDSGGKILGGLSSLGSLFSDRRLKRDIARVGALNDGTPIYRYRYIGDPVMRIGVMAQDVERTNPDAVIEVGGFKAVDYAEATERSARDAATSISTSFIHGRYRESSG